MMCGQGGIPVNDAVSTILTQTPDQKLLEFEHQFDQFKRFTGGITHDRGSPLTYTPGFMKAAILVIEKGETTRAMEYLTRATRLGEGIASTEIDSIFERYTQTERSRKTNQGVGLGLSICKDIIEAHGGNIWATNNDTKGANFRIRLPINRKSLN